MTNSPRCDETPSPEAQGYIGSSQFCPCCEAEDVNTLLPSWARRGVLRLSVFKQFEGCLGETLNTTSVGFNFSCGLVKKPYTPMKSGCKDPSPADLLVSNTIRMLEIKIHEKASKFSPSLELTCLYTAFSFSIFWKNGR